MTTKTKIMSAVALSLVGVALYLGIRPFVVGDRRMKAFCESLPSGTKWGAVQAAANRAGYRTVATSYDRPILVDDAHPTGRFICELELDEDVLISAKYVARD